MRELWDALTGWIVKIFSGEGFGSLQVSMPQSSQSGFSTHKWDSEIQFRASIYGVPWEFVKAIMWQESDLGRAKSVATGLENPYDVVGSRSSDGKSWGLMQMRPSTASEMMGTTVTEVGLNDPLLSIWLGTKYLGALFSEFKDLRATAMAYNQGPTSYRAGKRISVAYADSVMKRYERVKRGEV